MDKKWLSYWKKSLSDSLNGDIEINKSEYFEIENFDMSKSLVSELENVKSLIDEEEERTNKKKGIFDKTDENWQIIETAEVLISPIKLTPIPDHQVYFKGKKSIFPFWYRAILDREGKLSIPEEIFPVFQRRFLEPLADENTDFIFASMEDVDKAAHIGKESYKDYREYINYIREVFQAVVQQSLEEYKYADYGTGYNGIVLLPNEEINAAMSIIQLYEKILHEENLPALLKHFINLNHTLAKPPLDVSEFIEFNSLHLGQMGYAFPISISQRKSLYTFLKSNSKVFAVNGPPGTGKTTLLQSIVANKMVENAIKGSDAPIILACSTNNQAVTNIIESFSKSNTQDGALKGRWLPEIEGYATYLPSKSKESAALRNINYKKTDGDGLFNRIENKEYLKFAKKEFLKKSKAYFHLQYIGIEDIVNKLRDEISDIHTILEDASCKWKNYLDAEKALINIYRNENTKVEGCLSKSNISYELLADDNINNLTKLRTRIIEHFRNENLYRKLFCALNLKSAFMNRTAEVKMILQDSKIYITSDFIFKKKNILAVIDNKITIAKKIKQSIIAWESWKKQHNIKGNPPKTEEEYWYFTYLKLQPNASPNCFYDELDVTLRHKAFQLALHYWEGRWLLKLEEDLQNNQFDKKGIEPTKNRWRRQAMLTPCFVSTFYMSPKFFSAFRFLKSGEDGKNIFDEVPLFDFIDILIVDEAGQVSPEVGTATFALAKQAIVVGDVKQIEPVWSITGKVDIGNLKKERLIESYDDTVYEEIFDIKGFLASSGNIMKMAQNASDFKESGLTEKGVLLVEHRRCYDEIISYCNDLAYNGQLKPLRGKAKDLLFPPMYCIHVEGNSTRKNNSRCNKNEAKAIVDWLLVNKKRIEEKYTTTVEESVGIITPFVGQKNMLKDILIDADFDVSNIKLGTVHTLQGGERLIILFSMVYGKGDTGTMFFDRDNKPNMLNVAVSRAKDNFIVFANTNILDKNAKTPSGILANHLVYHPK
ncbi:MAG: AAA family ATPase [Prevotellaceae bacterium]|jgi:hypothetical protein|nr:AAA family ATPase [Prevotellaceae bacterium]